MASPVENWRVATWARSLLSVKAVPTLFAQVRHRAYGLPLGVEIWKQYRRSSQSTAITEQLSRS